MSKSFSPGEWQSVSEEKHLYIKSESALINDVCVLYRPHRATDAQVKEIEANAALIAQAPAMYEALDLSVIMLEKLNNLVLIHGEIWPPSESKELILVIKQILKDAKSDKF